MKRILCLWLPNWPIQRRVRTQSELSRAALVLYEASPRGGERMTHVSSVAAGLGAQPGISLADATARWPKRLRLEKADPHGDREELCALARQLGCFSPLVGLEDIECPESILLDITGIAVLFGGEGKLAEAANQVVAAKRLTGRMAIADTVGAAWAAAHFGGVDAPALIVVPVGESAAFLVPLPPEALRLSPTTLAQVAEFGLQTIGHVLALPRASLTNRLGPEILVRLSQALGERSEPIVPIESSLEFVVTWDFETDASRAEVIDAALRHLCHLLAAKLSHVGRGAGELHCTLRCASSASVAHTVGFFEPAASADHFHDLLRLRLERSRLPAAVSEIRLEAVRTSPIRSRQRELFPDHARAHEHEFTLLINRLAGRLGHQAVVRPAPRPEAQPELSWREEPLLESGVKKPRRKAPPARLPFGWLQRPLFLFHPPIPIQVTALLPDGPPARFVYGGKVYQVAHHVGPERIETGWWHKRGVRRDYYRVETETGQRFWLYRSLRKGHWRLHGEFA